MKPMNLVFVFVLAAATAAPGQILSADVSPNPANVGGNITFHIEATRSVDLMTGCALTAVHQGSPTGPVVFSPMICPSIFITIGPGGGWNAVWNGRNNANVPVPAGTYYVRFDYSDSVTYQPYPPTFIPVRIDNPAGPVPAPILTPNGLAARGQTLQLQINAPGMAYAQYIVAASFTTDTGIGLLTGEHVALDYDALFQLSFPVATPLLFSGFADFLDASGHTSSPAVVIPNLPVLASFPLAFQAVVFPSAGGFVLTNPVPRIIH